MYALNLGAGGRVLSVTWPTYAPSDAPTVETLPEGDTCDYLYRDGEFVYDPLPEEKPPIDETELLKAQVKALSERNDFMEDCIAEMATLVYA